MSMKVGDIIKPDDIPSAIKTKVESVIAGYTGSYSGYSDPNGRTNIMNAITAKANNPYKQNNDNKESGAVPGRLIKPYAVLNLIYEGMRQSCRLGTITYSQYSTTAYMNIPNYIPPKNTYTVSVIFGSVHAAAGANANAYCAKVAAQRPNVSDGGSKTTIQAQSDFLVGKLIRVVDLTDLLNKCVAVSRSITTSQNIGCINSCYTSCHKNCHGSSRSRR